MIKYILFDFDGTLVDSRQIALTIFNQLAGKYRFRKVAPEDIAQLRKLSIPERCRMLKLPIYKIPFIVMEARLLYTSYLQELCVFEGIKAMLDALTDQQFNLAVLSSNAQANIRTVLQKNQIGTITTIFPASSLFGKNAVIKKFLKISKLHPSQVIYVGDELRDVLACKKSGIRVIFVSWGYDSMEAVSAARPDYIANKPEDILSIVQAACS
jgi:phosphoglycolate phosphatase